MTLITPEAILSYVKGLFTPSAAAEGADEKYSVTLVFEDGTDLSELKKAAIDAARDKYGDDLDGAEIKVLETAHGPANFLVTPGGLRLRLPWRDHPDDVASKGYPEGSTFVNTRNSSPPGVVSQIPDADGSDRPARIVNANGDVRMADGSIRPAARPVYSGARGFGLLSVFAYDVSGNKGVSFGLQGVQVTGDGERLDGRTPVEDVFSADADAVADLSDMVGEDDDSLDDLLG